MEVICRSTVSSKITVTDLTSLNEFMSPNGVPIESIIPNSSSNTPSVS